jgi:co-chaperonin GroES (HSP10)
MTQAAYAPYRFDKLRALRDWVLVTDMEFSERITSNGIILPNDNGKGTGIRPRWGLVYATGPEQKDVSVGQWICVAHGRWTRGVEIEDGSGTKTLRRIDPKDILLVSDEQPSDDTMSTALHVDAKTR